MKKIVNFRQKPRPKPCDLVAAWPGIGNLSLIVTRYLREKLEAEEIGEIEPFTFFDPIGVMVKDNIVEEPQFPEGKFYYWHNITGKKDILFFISDEQPTFKGYDLANFILDIAKKFKVQRIYTFAAAIAKIHHTEMPKVWGVATNPSLINFLKGFDVILRGKLQIAGLNGLLLGVARERKMEGICLLGEVPAYTTRIPNPKAALAVMKILLKVLDLKIDLSDLSKIAEESDQQMKRLAAQAMGEYIDRYTRPIWPPPEEEEFEDEEDEEDEED
ncbi:MAG: PAC2 family protein [Dehalococcoidia bacterium]|nr:PAC2 family protein [Dehalococcoidia bacterium]